MRERIVETRSGLHHHHHHHSAELEQRTDGISLPAANVIFREHIYANRPTYRPAGGREEQHVPVLVRAEGKKACPLPS